MSSRFKSILGRQIYETLLPEIYRNRDNARLGPGGKVESLGDLANYLDAHGILLDLIRNTLDQRLADSFVDNPECGNACQEWLIPYFAQLVDARLVSPEAEGRRDEVSNAVLWRQRKGTLTCVEEIAESVGRMEVEIQEGWKRVAHTARVGMPLLPPGAYGDSDTLDENAMKHPLQAADHPGLNTVTVDVRKPLRALKIAKDDPVSHRSRYRGAEHIWTQLNPSGAPCFPGSYEDVTRRTVDIRMPDWKQGHFHPKRLMLFVAPPDGLFPPPIKYRTWNVDWDDYVSVEGNTVEKRSNHPVEITSNVTITEAGCHCIKNLRFARSLRITQGRVELRGVVAKEVIVEAAFDISDPESPVFIARDCLFGRIEVRNGGAKLDSCTVLGESICRSIIALDSIFAGNLTRPGSSEAPLDGVIEYCRIPASLSVSDPNSNLQLNADTLTLDEPGFFASGLSWPSPSGPFRLLNNGAGVLRPDSSASIYGGASDGGELGCFHHGRKANPQRISQHPLIDCPDNGGYPLEDLIFETGLSVNSGMLVLVRSAVNDLTVNSALLKDANGVVQPSLDARDCLFENIQVGTGLTRLEYCTVMQKADCKYIQASDCIFGEELDGVSKPPPDSPSNPTFINCIRYSRLPDKLPDSADILVVLHINEGLTATNTTETPIYHRFAYCHPEHHHRPAIFGESGYGVLHPATSESIRFGAEDQGEMGVYHYPHYTLREEAVIDKLEDYLPLDVKPVLIPDTRLLEIPARKKILETTAETSPGTGGVT
jgi:hypothetical protein